MPINLDGVTGIRITFQRTAEEPTFSYQVGITVNTDLTLAYTHVNSAGLRVNVNTSSVIELSKNQFMVNAVPAKFYNSPIEISGSSIYIDSGRSVVPTYIVTPGEGIQLNGKLHVSGSFTVQGTKSFRIPHPNPQYTYTRELYHSAVESPTAGDTLTTFIISSSVENETVQIDIPEYWSDLNINPRVFIQSKTQFSNTY